MSRPGYSTKHVEAAPGSGSLVETGAWYVAGLTEKGPLDPTTVYSASDFARKFGAEIAQGKIAEAVESYFAEGGSHVVMRRIVGAAAVSATRVMGQVTATAVNPGAWANSIKVAVTGASTTRFYTVTDAAGNVLEKSPDLATNALAVAWSQTSDYIRLTAAGTTLPTASAATALAGGADDLAGVVNADYVAALADLASIEGPGQVSIPGVTGQAIYAALIAHGVTTGRIPYLDVAASDVTVAGMKAQAALARAELGSHRAAMFGPWSIIPGKVPGTTRTAPASGAEAAKASRSDAATGNPNLAAAGDNGVSDYAIGLLADGFTQAERTELNEAGMNLIRLHRGQIKTYAFRTLGDPILHPEHWQLANVRLDMAIAAKAATIESSHTFRQIDGDDLEVKQFGGELEAMLADFLRIGAIYGSTAEEAYRVDVSVNTVQTAADAKLAARLYAKRSPMAELVEIEIAAVSLTAAV